MDVVDAVLYLASGHRRRFRVSSPAPPVIEFHASPVVWCRPRDGALLDAGAPTTRRTADLVSAAWSLPVVYRERSADTSTLRVTVVG